MPIVLQIHIRYTNTCRINRPAVKRRSEIYQDLETWSEAVDNNFFDKQYIANFGVVLIDLYRFMYTF